MYHLFGNLVELGAPSDQTSSLHSPFMVCINLLIIFIVSVASQTTFKRVRKTAAQCANNRLKSTECVIPRPCPSQCPLYLRILSPLNHRRTRLLTIMGVLLSASIISTSWRRLPNWLRLEMILNSTDSIDALATRTQQNRKTSIYNGVLSNK